MRINVLFLVVVLSLGCTAGPQAQNPSHLAALTSGSTRDNERVDAGKYFGTGGPPRIYIETDAGQILVFNAQHGDYVLSGKDLDIDSQVVEVTGDVVIRAYKAGEQAADETGVGGAGPNGTTSGSPNQNGGPGFNGAPGATGPTGRKGLPGSHTKLKIQKITGTGTLTVIEDGGGGGRGGVGGTGGNGGNGGKGSGRGCGNMFGSGAVGPGDGGAPGNGGDGGIGGMGGDGGDPGGIDYNKELKASLGSGMLKLEAKSGEPGPGGPGGPGGAGGVRGDGGDGAPCGGGGTPGRPPNGQDKRSIQSGPGAQPPRGADGLISCYNCSN